MSAKVVRVGLDVTPAVTTHGGLARYTVELWRELARREDLDLHAFALGRGPRGGFAEPLRRIRVPLRLLYPPWQLVQWPRAETFTGSVDVIHTLALRGAPTRLPHVVTVHDVLPITHPTLYPPGTEALHRRELGVAAGADAIVTTCEATAGEIVRVAGVPRERIAVIPPGPFLSTEGRASEDLPDTPYLFAVGQITPRKGFDLLAEAVARLGPSGPPVLVAGPDWWRADETREAIAAADVHGKVRLLGPVDDDVLLALYRHATLVCHPSRGEGFGMTCLEAMANGAPVVATDLPSVRELVDGTAELVPVDDADALAAALARLLEDEPRRKELAQAGLERAASYSWPRTAERVADEYRTVLQR